MVNLKPLLTTILLGAATLTVACGSADDDGTANNAAVSEARDVQGRYQATGTAPIQWIDFAPPNQYAMSRLDEQTKLFVEETGTYAFNDARTSLTVTSRGVQRQLKFAVVNSDESTSAGSVTPKAGLVIPGPELILELAKAIELDGIGFRLVADNHDDVCGKCRAARKGCETIGESQTQWQCSEDVRLPSPEEEQ